MNRRKIVYALILLVAGALIGSTVEALPRLVNYTLQAVTAAECTGIQITRQSNGAGGTVLVSTFSFEMKDAGGVVREFGATSVQLTPAQRTTLANFVTSVAVPQFNDEQDL